jgi:hypothetical protein
VFRQTGLGDALTLHFSGRLHRDRGRPPRIGKSCTVLAGRPPIKSVAAVPGSNFQGRVIKSLTMAGPGPGIRYARVRAR